jgi:voltage-gated potassium channel Kch
MVLGILVFVMSVVAFLQSLTWAGVYLWVGALSNFHEAIYFSLVTFTTLGYGDITLKEEWRLLAGFQAANGIIMFGVTTAIIVAVVHRIFALSHASENES